MSGSRERTSVMIMAGGTGGHIFPGLAVADALRQRGVPVEWLGARGGMECTTVPAAGVELHAVDIGGLRGKGILRWLTMPYRLIRAVWQAVGVLEKASPACALSFGGYAAGPGGLAARLRGIPLLVHEQNRVPGLTNSVLSKLAKRVLQAFPGTFDVSTNAVTTGNPVRDSVCALPEPNTRFANRTGRARLLITGGSQGAQILNNVVPRALAAMPEELRPQVRHQSGRGRIETTRDSYLEAGVNAEVAEFIDDMAEAYGWADLVVCRSGALTVSELSVSGVGALLVPFPHAVDDHQARNAEVLVEAGAAQMIREEDLDADQLGASFGELFADRDRLLSMANRARAVGIPDAASRVADACCEWVGQ